MKHPKEDGAGQATGSPQPTSNPQPVEGRWQEVLGRLKQVEAKVDRLIALIEKKDRQTSPAYRGVISKRKEIFNMFCRLFATF